MKIAKRTRMDDEIMYKTSTDARLNTSAKLKDIVAWKQQHWKARFQENETRVG